MSIGESCQGPPLAPSAPAHAGGQARELWGPWEARGRSSTPRNSQCYMGPGARKSPDPPQAEGFAWTQIRLFV